MSSDELNIPKLLNDYTDVTYDETELSEKLLKLITLTENFERYVSEAIEIGFSEIEIIKNWLAFKKINIIKLV